MHPGRHALISSVLHALSQMCVLSLGWPMHNCSRDKRQHISLRPQSIARLVCGRETVSCTAIDVLFGTAVDVLSSANAAETTARAQATRPFPTGPREQCSDWQQNLSFDRWQHNSASSQQPCLIGTRTRAVLHIGCTSSEPRPLVTPAADAVMDTMRRAAAERPAAGACTPPPRAPPLTQLRSSGLETLLGTGPASAHTR